MSVEFPEEQQGAEYEAPKTPTMVKWVMKTGLVKDEKQANIVLVVVAIVFFALTWWFIAGGSTPATQPTYLEDIPVDVLETIPPEILKAIPSRN